VASPFGEPVAKKRYPDLGPFSCLSRTAPTCLLGRTRIQCGWHLPERLVGFGNLLACPPRPCSASGPTWTGRWRRCCTHQPGPDRGSRHG